MVFWGQHLRRDLNYCLGNGFDNSGENMHGEDY